MKRTITLFLFLLLLLPTMAQKPFTARVVAGKDYPYYITSVMANTREWAGEGDKATYIDHRDLYFEKLDHHTYTLKRDTAWLGTITFYFTVMDQQGTKKYLDYSLRVPVIPGEQLAVTLHDVWDVEIGGSQLYREYGNAWRAILHQDKPVKDYVAKHRKERGCALFVLSEQRLPDYSPFYEERVKLLDSTSIGFLGDAKELDTKSIINTTHSDNELSKMCGLYDYFHLGRANPVPFDRQLEGQALIDAVGEKYRGKPTLVSVWSYGASNTCPDAYELYVHAKGMNQVHLTSVKGLGEEMYWKSSIRHYPGDHYLQMRYQVDSLFQLYMPDVAYSAIPGRHFYILLDEEGKVVAHGDRLHDYRQLITLTDQLKAKAGLPPFKEKPYEVKYLDTDATSKQSEEEKLQIFRQARERMCYEAYMPFEGYESYKYTKNVLYAPTAKQLNISQRLYDRVRKTIEEENKERHDGLLQTIAYSEARKAKMQDDYKPDLEAYSKDMAIGRPVDLGLSVMWADMNVGSKTAEDFGMYFAWGDPEPVKMDDALNRGWYNYRWCKGSETTLRKYNTKEESGAVDMCTTILPEDDAATMLWKEGWRMPSKEEMDELLEKCQWEWTVQNFVQGYKVTGPNGNSIFLPATGCLNYQGKYGQYQKGYYWTADVNADTPKECYYLYFGVEKQGTYSQDRYAGRCIRAVCSK